MNLFTLFSLRILPLCRIASRTRFLSSAVVLFIFIYHCITLLAQQYPLSNTSSPSAHDMLRQKYSFEENKGQWPEEVLFRFSERDAQSWITRTGLTLDYFQVQPNGTESIRSGHVIRMKFLGGKTPQPQPKQQLSAVSNYLLGADQEKHIAAVRSFEKVELREIYEGISAEFLSVAQHIRYDMHVQPFSSPEKIQLEFTGTHGVELSADHKNLTIKTSLGNIIHSQLRAYQIDRVSHDTIDIDCTFILRDSVISFAVGKYDSSQELVIDPVISATYLGGLFSDAAKAITRDASGNLYVVGQTISGNFPTTVGVYSEMLRGGFDAFVTKIRPALNQIEFSTFIGGSSDDYANSIAITSNGQLVIVGMTYSLNFPVQDPISGGLSGTNDAFVLVLNPTGQQLITSTYWGGASQDEAKSVALDPTNNIYVVGYTISNDFPRQFPFSASYSGAYDAFLTKFTAQARAVQFSTYLGGSGLDVANGVAVDGIGTITVVGETSSPNFPRLNEIQTTFGGVVDGFITRFTPAGNSLQYSTYLGGTLDDGIQSVVLDGLGRAVIVGRTASSNFPTQQSLYNYSGASDGFIAKIANAGNSLIFSTLIGGSAQDSLVGVALEPSGRIVAVGSSNSVNFPTTNAGVSTIAGGTDCIYVKLSVNGDSLLYSRYVGGNGRDQATSVVTDANGNSFFCGVTNSPNFPITGGVIDTTYNQQDDAFICAIGTLSTTVQLLSPNGGEFACAGDETLITWESRSAVSVNLFLSTDGGATYPNVIATGVPAPIGRFTWRLPTNATASTQCRIRIQTVGGTSTVTDISDANFSIGAAPKILEEPISTTACVGNTVSFRVACTTFPPVSYSWEQSTNGIVWTVFTAQVASTLTLSNVQIAQNNLRIRAVLRNACSTLGTISTIATLTVLTPPQITSQPQNVIVCDKRPFSLSVVTNMDSQSNTTYQWFQNDVPIAGATARELLIPSASISSAGNYKVLISGFCNPPTMSQSAQVQVQELPDFTVPAFTRKTCVGLQNDTTFTLRNRGPLPVRIRTGILDNPKFQILLPTADTTLQPNQTLQAKIRYIATDAVLEFVNITFPVETIGAISCQDTLRIRTGARIDSVELLGNVQSFPIASECRPTTATTAYFLNSGDVELVVSSVTFGDTQFSTDVKLPFTLAPKRDTTIAVYFNSNGAAATFSSTMRVQADKCGLVRTYPIQATRSFIEVRFNQPDSVVFPLIADCRSFSQKVIQITNTGAPISFSRFQSTNPAFSVISPSSGFKLGSNESKTMILQFSPSGSGRFSGEIQLLNDLCPTPISVKVVGERTSVLLSPSAAAVNWSDIRCATQKDTVIRLTNVSPTSVTVQSISLDGDFVLLSLPTLPLVLSQNTQTTLSVRAIQNVLGLTTGTLRVALQTESCADTVVIPLSIFWKKADPKIDFDSLAFPVLGSCENYRDTTFFLKNFGNTEIAFQNLSVTSDIKLLNALPVVVPAGDSVRITLRFAPLTTGSVTGQAVFLAQECNSQVRFSVSGTKQGTVLVLSTSGILLNETECFAPNPTTQASIVLFSAFTQVSTKATLQAITFSPKDAPFSTSLKVGDVLESNRSTTFSVTFRTDLYGQLDVPTSATVELVFQPCDVRQVFTITGIRTSVAATSLGNVAFGVVSTTSTNERDAIFVNTGTSHVRFDSVSALLPPLSIVSVSRPYSSILSPNDTVRVRVRATKPQVPFSQQLMAFFSGPCVRIASSTISGEGRVGPQPLLVSSTQLVQFGDEVISLTTSQTLRLTNIGGATARPISLSIVGGNAGDFTLLEPLQHDSLEVSSSATVRLGFTPTALGVRRSTLIVKLGVDDVIIVELLGNGKEQTVPVVGTTVVLPDKIVATPGERFLVPIRYIPGQNFSQVLPTDYTLRLEFPAELMTVDKIRSATFDSSFSGAGNSRKLIITARGKRLSGDTLAVVEATALLGHIDRDSLRTLAFQWTNTLNSISFINGQLQLTRICRWEDRLISLESTYGFVRVSPNPANTDVEVGFLPVESGLHELRVFTPLGDEVYREIQNVHNEFFTQSYVQNILQFRVPARNFATGSYVISVRTPHDVQATIIIISK